MKFPKFLAASFVMLLLPVICFSTTLIKVSEEDMIQTADRVAVGTIVDSWVEWDGDSEMLFTYSVLALEENLLGDEPGTGSVILRSPGGQHENMGVRIPSTPEISRIGERKVVFMWDTLDLYPCNIIGWEQGCRTVSENGMVEGTGKSLSEYINILKPIIREMKKEEAKNSF